MLTHLRPRFRLNIAKEELLLPFIIGALLGGVAILAYHLPTAWGGLIVMGIAGVTATLWLNDLKRALLIALTVDQGLGLDIALANVPHLGGPGGFTISLMSIAIVAGYIQWFIEPHRRPLFRHHRDVVLPAALFLLLNLASGLQAVYLRFTITLTVLLAQCFLMYLYLVNYVTDWQDVRLILMVLALLLGAQASLMVVQYTTGAELDILGMQSKAYVGNTASVSGRRVAGTLASPNAAATFLMFSMLITLAGFLSEGHWINKYLAAGSLGMGSIALIATYSRSGWIGFAVGAVVVASIAWYRKVGRQEVVMLTVGGLMLMGAFSREIISRLTGDDNNSALSRIWQTKLAFNIIRAHMFTGIGANNLVFVERDYLPIELMGTRRLYMIHNKYWSVWVETGLFGLLSFLWLLIAPLWRAVRGIARAVDPYESILMAGLLAALGGYAFHMTGDPFSSRLRIEPLWFLIAMIVATSRLIRSKHVDTEHVA